MLKPAINQREINVLSSFDDIDFDVKEDINTIRYKLPNQQPHLEMKNRFNSVESIQLKS